MPCGNCDKFKGPMTHENWAEVLDELVSGTKSNALTYLGGTSPLDETKDHIRTETRYSVIQNFRCSCGTRIEWGVCIRGTPMLRLHND